MQNSRAICFNNMQNLHIYIDKNMQIIYNSYVVINMTLKELRISKGITQAQAAELCSISLRSYVTYENDVSKSKSIKYGYIFDVLSRFGVIDETHGILKIDEIKERCYPVFSEYGVKYCYLFGSYAKSTATQTSDVDLLVSSDVKGMRFFGMTEALREALGKKTDVLDFNQLENNHVLLNEILADGVKIYG